MKIILRNAQLKFESVGRIVERTLEVASTQTSAYLNGSQLSQGDYYNTYLYDITNVKSLKISGATARSNGELGCIASVESIPSSKDWTSSPSGIAVWNSLFTNKQALNSPNYSGSNIESTTEEDFQVPEGVVRNVLMVQSMKANANPPIVIATY